MKKNTTTYFTILSVPYGASIGIPLKHLEEFLNYAKIVKTSGYGQDQHVDEVLPMIRGAVVVSTDEIEESLAVHELSK